MKGYRISFTFEGFSGADIILTPSKEIISQNTIQRHLDAGAVLIQVKHSRDFDKSVLDQRLFESLLRMTTWDTYQHQCGLLITGDFKNIKGQLHIDGKRSSITWSSFLGALNSWVVRGGVVYPTIDRSDLQFFLDLLGQKLFIKDAFVQAPTARPRKKFKPKKQFSKGMTLSQRGRLTSQGIDEDDLRHLLININGLSSKVVQGIWNLMKKEFKSGDMNMAAFLHLVEKNKLIEVDGIGPKTVEKVKRQLGYE